MNDSLDIEQHLKYYPERYLHNRTSRLFTHLYDLMNENGQLVRTYIKEQLTEFYVDIFLNNCSDIKRFITDFVVEGFIGVTDRTDDELIIDFLTVFEDDKSKIEELKQLTNYSEED